MAGSKERGRERREETEGGFLFNSDFHLFRTYLSRIFLGKVRICGFLQERLLPFLARAGRDTMNPLYFPHRGNMHKKEKKKKQRNPCQT